MKQNLLLSAFVIFSLILISWGVTGHHAIGKIAENHLSSNAQAAVKDLLGNENMADVSTWADQLRMKPEFKYTTPWHYINLPLGLTYTEFKDKVEHMTEDNVYSAMLKQEQILSDSSSTRDKKIDALKFIIHFVGDLHQPMHISRAEDQGGNTIKVNYEGKETNLHSLWDTKLVEHQGLNYEDLAAKYDHIPDGKIKQWQRDPLIKWMWESYQISSTLYKEADETNGHEIDENYYKKHMPIVELRIQQAGIRLAGVLNDIFKDTTAKSEMSGTAPIQ
ncbi:S1/P1 nuclease [Pedobacter sp. L105]|uniref:S1/P1 nuclease n=1 Tax=Pedobacter sp. L105 TaxID=1641871 RepID=UPI00131E576E|nr:S1/P1 nuclease [Pedobacter sp. L105]